ncbi:2-thiouracil desulfurase family protein, partial [Clostridium butyricum]
MRKPKLIISKCLNSEKCRFDGQGYDDKVISLLRDYVDIETVCPETSIGLSIPRNPLRIEKDSDINRLIEAKSNVDYTYQMCEFAEEFINGIDDIDGFILKSRSPSCGIKDVKVYPKAQKCSISKNATGIFSSKVIEGMSNIPIENEGRLKNYNIRDEFLTKIFTINDFKCTDSILDFHNKNILLLKSYSTKISKELDSIANKQNLNEKDIDL